MYTCQYYYTIITTYALGLVTRGKTSFSRLRAHPRVMQKSDPVKDLSAQPLSREDVIGYTQARDGIICQTCQGDSGATVAWPNEASRNSSAKHVDDLSGPLHPD